MGILPTAAVQGEWFVGMRETAFRPAMTPAEREAFRHEWEEMHRGPWPNPYPLPQEIRDDIVISDESFAEFWRQQSDVRLGA
jgi:hypothetical protein